MFSSKLLTSRPSNPILSIVKREYVGLARHYDWGGTHQKHLLSHKHLILTPEEARLKALALYRRSHTHVSFIRKQYNVPMNHTTMKKVIRDEFEKNKNVHHIAAREKLLRAGYILLFETTQVHIMNSHVYEFFSRGNYSQGILNDQQRVIEEISAQTSAKSESSVSGYDDNQIIQYVASKFDELDLQALSKDREKAFKEIVYKLIVKTPEFDIEMLLEKGLRKEINEKMDQFLH